MKKNIVLKLGGLNPTPHDDRDFQLGAIIDLPDLKTLPKNFEIPLLSIKDQKSTDFCTGAMKTGMSEPQEGIELSMEWGFASSKYLTKDKDSWGQNIRSALASSCEMGDSPKNIVPFSLENKSPDFCRDFLNYPLQIKHQALPHKKKSYFKVTGPYDHFDNIRASIYKFKAEKRVVGFGTYWSWPLSQVMMEKPPKKGFGHAMYIRGWKEVKGKPYAIVQNSAGKDAGENGHHYFSREVINAMVELYGAYMFVDLDKEEAKRMLENGIKMHDNWVVDFMKVFKTLMSLLWNSSKK